MKENKKLQSYFNFWYKYLFNEKWFNNLRTHFLFVKELKEKIQTVSSREDFENILNELLEISKHQNVKATFYQCNGIKKEYKLEDFLNVYLYKKDCHIGSIGQGNYSQKDRETINQNIDINNFFNLFKVQDEIKLYDLINKLFKGSKNYKAAKHRLFRTLMPCSATALDADEKFYSLITVLKEKLGINFANKNNLEIEQFLMNSFECSEMQKEYTKLDCCAIKQIFFWYLYEGLLNLEFSAKKAKVYYGAPGTGKTYTARSEAKKLIDAWKLRSGIKKCAYNSEDLIDIVQFHPSFGYEDFIEGLRPDGSGNFKKVDGTFKEFCKKAGKFEIELWKDKNFRDKFKDKDFCEIKVDEVKKTVSDNDLIKCLGDNDEFTLDEIIKPAVFIIDEINRAEISKVFGELMYAMEYRGYKGKIKTQYSYLKQSSFFEEDGQDYFFIPHNVYIFATMNTIDKSVDIFDFAMRRRFEWEKAKVNYSVINSAISSCKKEIVHKVTNSELAQKISFSLKNLNQKINSESLLGEDYEIGHAYILGFLKCNSKVFNKINDFKTALWNKNLEPLLNEYLKGLADNKEIADKLMQFKEAWDSKK